MKSFSLSENIQIFPISHTREYSNADAPILHNGRLLTEPNLTAIFKGSSEKNAFVISADTDAVNGIFSTSAYIDFMIGGYFIHLSLHGNAINLADNLYANVSVNDANYNEIEDVLNVSDNIWQLYRGVIFSNSITDVDTAQYRLHLLTKDADNRWVIPESSWYRFSTKSIENIDGGIV